MIILVSGATKTVKKYIDHPNIGQLITPHDGNIVRCERWAADNAAYSRWDGKAWLKMLDKIEGTDPIFVACPDVVGDAKATAKRFKICQPMIKRRGLKVALVIQNGQEWIGWATNEKNFDAIFIGGDDEFKLGKYARYCARKAKSIGKWVHMGRVNSYKRLDYAREIGCDSIDGSGFSMFPDQKIPKFLRRLETEQLTFKFNGEF